MKRRDFLKQCAVVGGTGIVVDSFYNPTLAATRPNEYRAMVNVYMQGGNDLNMLVPTDQAQYTNYRNLRGNLAVPENELLPITSVAGSTTTNYGLHPACAEMQGLYNNNKLAFLANIGTLKAPINKQQLTDRTRPMPPRLFAHNSQVDFIHAGLPFEGERETGWAGRVADSYNLTQSDAPFTISTVGNNLWLRGAQTTQFSFGVGLGPILNYRNDIPAFRNQTSRANAAFALQEANDYDNVLVNEIGKRYRQAVTVGNRFLPDQLDNTPINTPFPNSIVANQLKEVIRLMRSRTRLGHNQQIFYVLSPDWDMHTDLIRQHSIHLGRLSSALHAFHQATIELGLEDQVTTFTSGEFGRTLTSNGNGGSDHGWGGVQAVMGGAIDGGKVLGEYPQFVDADPQFLSLGGNLIPTIAVDQLSASVASWFGGFTTEELVELFPNLANFNDKTLPIYV